MALQQPAEAFLQMRVVDERVVQPQGRPAQPKGGVDQEAHRALQDGQAVRPGGPLNDHVLLHTPQAVKDKVVRLGKKTKPVIIIVDCLLRI